MSYILRSGPENVLNSRRQRSIRVDLPLTSPAARTTRGSRRLGHRPRIGELSHEGPVVLFDGVCNLCNAAVQFMIDRDRAGALRFAPLQSDVAKELLDGSMGPEKAKAIRDGATGNGDPDTIVLVEQKQAWTHSDAALRIARRLTFPWSWLIAGVIVPRPIRDIVYRFIARNRYRWFGKSDTCRIPTPELRARFLA